MLPDNTGEQQAGRFRKGQSGNPAGRPRGTRNSATADASELSKVVACTVKSFEAAEFADSLVPLDQLTDTELLRIAAGGSAPEIIGPRLLTIGSR